MLPAHPSVPCRGIQALLEQPCFVSDEYRRLCIEGLPVVPGFPGNFPGIPGFGPNGVGPGLNGPGGIGPNGANGQGGIPGLPGMGPGSSSIGNSRVWPVWEQGCSRGLECRSQPDTREQRGCAQGMSWLRGVLGCGTGAGQKLSPQTDPAGLAPVWDISLIPNKERSFPWFPPDLGPL